MTTQVEEYSGRHRKFLKSPGINYQLVVKIVHKIFKNFVKFMLKSEYKNRS
jgi:hypothetical protein